MNQLFYGDNMEVLQKHIGDESVDLCYVDPPFNSQRNYNQIYNNIGKDDIAQSQAFVDTWEWGLSAELQLDLLRKEPKYTRRLVETIHGLERILGKGAMLAYLVSMAVRFAEIWRVLKPTGSFYVHCDPTASHYLKLLLDSIFCDRGGKFNNEIIWRRHYSHNDGRKLGCIHDTVFYYTKSKNYTYHRQHFEYDADYIATHYNRTDAQGRQFRSVSMNGAGQGEPRYFGDKLLTPPKGRHWIWTQDRINKALDEGKIFFTSKGVPRYKQFLEDMQGVPVQDTWTDFYSLSSHDRERLGYATQKPLALLERIIKLSSNEGDVILDAFCGCGTTVDAAHSLNRKWIGIDITYNAVSLILKRLKDRYGNDIEQQIQLSGIPHDIESATALANKKDDRLRKEFEKWAILTYTDNQGKINEKKGSDKGIDGIAYIIGGTALFSVKSGGASVKDVRDLRGVVERESAAAGVLLTLEEPTKPMLQEAATSGYIEDIPGLRLPKKISKLQIVTIQELIDGARMNLPLAESVVKSAQRHKSKDKNRRMDFDGETEPQS
jgi:DNA modification methylase